MQTVDCRGVVPPKHYPKIHQAKTLVSVKGFKSTMLIQKRISTANEGSIANSDKNINKIWTKINVGTRLIFYEFLWVACVLHTRSTHRDVLAKFSQKRTWTMARKKGWHTVLHRITFRLLSFRAFSRITTIWQHGKFPLSWARAEHLLDAQGFLRQEQKVNVETGSQDFSGGCGSPPFV